MSRGRSKVHIPTVSLFLEMGRDRLRMELVAGEAGLGNRIPEATVHRPGLALAGFFAHFAHRRIQVIGLAENAYLRSLRPDDRERRLRDVFGRGVPCVVVSRGRTVDPGMRRLAEEAGVPVLRTTMVTKHFINGATIIMENLMAPRGNVQGTMLDVMGVGVLIEGKPGIGKSETALALIRRGYSLVSDDVTGLRVDSSGSLVGAPVTLTRYHMNIRGVGIVHVPSLFGVGSVRSEKRLDLVVTLCGPGAVPDAERAGEAPTREFLGVRVPRVWIPVAPGRTLADLVETAAWDQKLKRLGHDAEKELDERVLALTSGGRNASE
jgi:HPr kinase/phosphorylase